MECTLNFVIGNLVYIRKGRMGLEEASGGCAEREAVLSKCSVSNNREQF